MYAAEEVKALDQSWHASCFCCKACNKSLRAGEYKEHNAWPYCDADYRKLFGPKGIGFGVLGDTGEAGNANLAKPDETQPNNDQAPLESPCSSVGPRSSLGPRTSLGTSTQVSSTLNHFVSTAPKCPACGKSVYAAEEIKAMGESWHKMCFCCKACGRCLQIGQYKEHDGQPYCDADYSKLFGTKGIGFGMLADTGEPGRTSVGQPRHSMEPRKSMDSLQASQVASTLNNFVSTAPKCPACGKSVYAAEEIKAMRESWHKACFCCKSCGKCLPISQYKEHDGQPYCDADYSKLFGPKGIGFGMLADTGDARTSNTSHAGDAPLQVPSQSPRPSTQRSGARLTPSRSPSPSDDSEQGPKCPACGLGVNAGDEVFAMDNCWHVLCFCCKTCGKSLRGGQYRTHDGRSYCELHYRKLFGMVDGCEWTSEGIQWLKSTALMALFEEPLENTRITAAQLQHLTSWGITDSDTVDAGYAKMR